MATLSGTFSGETYWKDGRRLFSGSAYIKFSDVFQDPYDITQFLQAREIIDAPPEWITRLSNMGGTIYTIEDFWTISIEGDTEFCETYGNA